LEILQAFAEALAFVRRLVRLTAMACKTCGGLGSADRVSAYTQVHGNSLLKFICSINGFSYTNKATVVIMVVEVSCFLVADWSFVVVDLKTIFPIARTGGNNVKIATNNAKTVGNVAKFVNDGARITLDNVKTDGNDANFINVEAKLCGNDAYFTKYDAYFEKNEDSFKSKLAFTETKDRTFVSIALFIGTTR
jgi:hypothetical protein